MLYTTIITYFNFGPFDPPQLATMIVPPSMNGACSTPGQRPIFRAPVEPDEQLLVMFPLEDVMPFVLPSVIFFFRSGIHQFLADFKTESGRQLGPVRKSLGYACSVTVASEPGPLVVVVGANNFVQLQVTGQRDQGLDIQMVNEKH